MKRLVAGMVFGALLMSAAQAQEQQKEERVTKFEELAVGPVSGGAFEVPPTFGRLVNVVVSSDIHYLYFEDSAGTIRVVQIGLRSASQRARNHLQLLSPSVLVMKRGMESAPDTGT